MAVDVGEALAAYLSAGRPKVESRAVSLLVNAPVSAITASDVGAIVRRACERAGIPEAATGCATAPPRPVPTPGCPSTCCER